MLPFLGSVLHMLTYSLVALLGPVGAGEEEAAFNDEDDEDRQFEKELGGGEKMAASAGRAAEPRSGAQATATYYAAVQVRGIESKSCGGGRGAGGGGGWIYLRCAAFFSSC